MSNAMKDMGEAFDAQRKEWYGDLWDKVDWYGIPKADLPQAEREDIMAKLKTRLLDPDVIQRGVEIEREKTTDDGDFN